MADDARCGELASPVPDEPRFVPVVAPPMDREGGCPETPPGSDATMTEITVDDVVVRVSAGVAGEPLTRFCGR